MSNQYGQVTIKYSISGEEPPGPAYVVHIDGLPRDLFDAIPARDEMFTPDDNRFPSYYIKQIRHKGCRLIFRTEEGPDGRIEGVLDPEEPSVGILLPLEDGSTAHALVSPDVDPKTIEALTDMANAATRMARKKMKSLSQLER